ncbi:hypothetical protein I5L36_11880 [Serratia marcescens]|nr:hypothetical protein [Serratia marcescens]
MKRIVIWTSIFTAFAVFLLVYPLSGLNWKPFRCNAQLTARVTTNNNTKIDLNVNINIISHQEDQNEVLFVGSLKEANKNYTVYRRIFVTSKPADINGYSTAVITSEEHNPNDNVPDTLWHTYVLPDIPGVEFYAKTREIGKNLLFYRGLEIPMLVCTITNN